MLVRANLRHALAVAQASAPRDDLQGGELRKAIVSYWRRSNYVRAVVIEGRCIAIGGAIGALPSLLRDPRVSHQAEIWAAVGEEAKLHPRAVVLAAQEGIADALRVWSELVATVIASDETSLRFARHLGFSLGEETLYGGIAIRWARYVPPFRKAA